MHATFVWDFPTRLFHWLLVIALGSQFVTAELLDNAMDWHFYGGYFTLGLIVFRLVWGLVGSYYARFSQFVVSPQKAMAYGKSLAFSDSPLHAGHNPLGAYSVIVILTIVLTQAISGLFISDDIFHQGPYYTSANDITKDVAAWLHHNLFNAVWVFLAFHLGAMTYYKIEKKQSLTKAMITGYKHLPTQHKDANNYWLRFVLAVIAVSALLYLVLVVWAPEVVDEYYY